MKSFIYKFEHFPYVLHTIYMLSRNVVVEWFTLLRFLEVPGSNYDLETGYPE
jgi:hypothetical protein